MQTFLRGGWKWRKLHPPRKLKTNLYCVYKCTTPHINRGALVRIHTQEDYNYSAINFWSGFQLAVAASSSHSTMYVIFINVIKCQEFIKIYYYKKRQLLSYASMMSVCTCGGFGCHADINSHFREDKIYAKYEMQANYDLFPLQDLTSAYKTRICFGCSTS